MAQYVVAGNALPMPPTTAREKFDKHDNLRQNILARCEQYARWTVPKLFPMSSRSQDSEALVHDFQALGAQCVNHLANRLMLTMFAPSRPFFRLEATKSLKKQMEEAGQNSVPPAVRTRLAMAEKEASEEVDRRSLRSKLYDLIKYIIVLGNALLIFEKDTIRALNLRNYVVKRNVQGEVVELIIKEKVHFESLTADVKSLTRNNPLLKMDSDGYVFQYLWTCIDDNGKYKVETWIDDAKLPPQYEHSYPKDRLPYRAVTWDLAAGDDYGTGLVEDYAGDFASLSALSKATIQAAILASEFRWLVNPTGLTSPEDFQESENGAALAGSEGDISLVQSGVQSNLQVNLQVQQMYVNRIGYGFLLQSATTRDAERVTAFEIRRNAEELESSLGGAYSRIAVDVQLPVAYWVLKLIDKDIIGKDIEPMIVTGLAALSRIGDRDNLLSFGQNLLQLLNLPPQILDRLNLSEWMADLAAADSLDPNKYVKGEAQYQQEQQARAQQALQYQNASQQLTAQNTPET